MELKAVSKNVYNYHIIFNQHEMGMLLDLVSNVKAKDIYTNPEAAQELHKFLVELRQQIYPLSLTFFTIQEKS
jgi:hypothetical protein